MTSFFPRLFGNDKTKNRIGSAILSGTLPHAFLICGPRGSGKKTLTLEIAAAVNCQHKGKDAEALPCHRCNSCRRILSDSFVDVKTLEKRKDKQSIGVEEIRLFRSDMFLSATESDYKVYIIEDAEKMTSNAQNALLKVLEEPPSGTLIFLLTESEDGILTTIKSRTQHISMQRFDTDSILAYLKGAGKLPSAISGERLSDILMCSNGCIGQALELLREGEADASSAQRAITAEIVRAMKQNTAYSALYSAVRGLPTKKDEFTAAIESIISALRDLIVLKNAPNAHLLFYSDRVRAAEDAEGISTRRLMAIYDIMRAALEDCAKNVNIAAITASLGAKIKLIN